MKSSGTARVYYYNSTYDGSLSTIDRIIGFRLYYEWDGSSVAIATELRAGRSGDRIALINID